MSNKCAREGCGKTVYPLEELKCLDKVWHKLCFKCTTCGMALNMKTYKGYEKKPYCEAHYPKTVASVVADTPEMRRIAENTKLQSQVQYHAEYEKMKGTRIQIADDPEMQRHMANTKVQSQAAYHGEGEKKRLQEANRPSHEQQTTVAAGGIASTQHHTNFPASTNGGHHHEPNHQPPMSIGSIYNRSQAGYGYNNGEESGVEPRTLPPTATTVVRQDHNSNSSKLNNNHNNQQNSFHQDGRSGGIKDSPYSQRLAQQAGSLAAVYGREDGQTGRVPPEPRQVGSISDYDPMNGQWGGGAARRESKEAAVPAAESAGKAATTAVAGSPSKQRQQQPQQQVTPQQQPVSRNNGFTVKALYDYTAADKDEVSFKENDIIVNCAKVDEGWLTGTVQRTLMWGMLPANYVEKVNPPTGMYKLK